jgi:hypothetical protein
MIVGDSLILELCEIDSEKCCVAFRKRCLQKIATSACPIFPTDIITQEPRKRRIPFHSGSTSAVSTVHFNSQIVI